MEDLGCYSFATFGLAFDVRRSKFLQPAQPSTLNLQPSNDANGIRFYRRDAEFTESFHSKFSLSVLRASAVIIRVLVTVNVEREMSNLEHLSLNPELSTLKRSSDSANLEPRT